MHRSLRRQRALLNLHLQMPGRVFRCQKSRPRCVNLHQVTTATGLVEDGLPPCGTADAWAYANGCRLRALLGRMGQYGILGPTNLTRYEQRHVEIGAGRTSTQGKEEEMDTRGVHSLPTTDVAGSYGR